MKKYETDEDFKDVTESGNSLVVFSFILIIIGLAVFGYFFILQKVNFAPKTVTVELGSTLSLDVNDYLLKKKVDTSGFSLNLNKVDTSEIGTYQYTISYNKIVRKGNVKVVDSTPPTFEVKNVKIEATEDNFYLGSFLSSCDDASLPCLVSLKNDSDYAKFKTPGIYNIKIVVADIFDNKKETEVEVEVVEKGTLVLEEENDLIFAKSSIELDNFKDEYYLKLNKAIAPNSEESSEITSEIDIDKIEKYVDSEYPNYKIVETRIVEMYNKSGYIMGYVVRLTLNNGQDKIIYYQDTPKQDENEKDEQ